MDIVTNSSYIQQIIYEYRCKILSYIGNICKGKAVVSVKHSATKILIVTILLFSLHIILEIRKLPDKVSLINVIQAKVVCCCKCVQSLVNLIL